MFHIGSKIQRDASTECLWPFPQVHKTHQAPVMSVHVMHRHKRTHHFFRVFGGGGGSVAQHICRLHIGATRLGPVDPLPSPWRCLQTLSPVLLRHYCPDHSFSMETPIRTLHAKPPSRPRDDHVMSSVT